MSTAEITRGTIVRIGNGALFWRVSGFDSEGNAVLVGMSRELDGTFHPTRYIPGRVSRKVVPVARLTAV